MRERTPDEVRELKRRGVFDVGLSTITLAGPPKPLRYRFWDGYVPPEERDD